ncbi:MAG TPA: PorP/SprF family type IX secretion system membrane protein [Bacteroidales bacterium]
MKSLSTILLFLLFCPGILHSQESSIFNNYYLSPFIINPAMTGSEDYPMAAISAKKQWIGIPQAPSTYLISGNYRIGNYNFYDPKGFVNKGPLKLKDRIGLGAALYKDVNGPSDGTGGLLSYAYHLPVNRNSRLSFGLSVIGTYYIFNNSLLKPDQADDPYLFSNNDNTLRVNMNFGIYYYSDIYFAGISSAKILPDITNINDNVTFQPSYFLTGGYKFMHNEANSFEPSIVLKLLNSQRVSADLYAKFYLKWYNWISLSYSTTGKMNFLFGVRLRKMLYAGYNFEYSLSKIARYNNGSHEVYLGINLGLRGADFIRYRSSK